MSAVTAMTKTMINHTRSSCHPFGYASVRLCTPSRHVLFGTSVVRSATYNLFHEDVSCPRGAVPQH
jgi:hypothetical protein